MALNSADEFAKALAHLQLKQLRQLAAVAERGSIRAAAKHLAIAQPALSRSIRSLEESLGLAVIERGPRGVEITKYGDALLKYTRIIDANLRFAADELDTLRARPTGSVRFGMGSFEGRTIGARAVARVMRLRPDIDISIVDGNSSVLLPRLLSGEIDFMFGPAPLEGITAGVTGEILTAVKSVLAVRARHPLAQRKRLQLSTLARADWIIPSRGSAAYQRLANLFRQHGLEVPHGNVEAPAVSLIQVGLILAHDLVGVVAPELMQHELLTGDIKILPIDPEPLSIPIYLARREFGQLPPAARDLINELRRACCDIEPPHPTALTDRFLSLPD